ncbi:MAG: SMC-Scp complex subunit ScpB [Candidatus Pelagibacter sp. TMED64]|nr:SMC-Scp complex subunit ScpB [Candidatus Pelagibacter sp.]OUU66075.1 MAG: SMC-Scp complex subunit ScpB [Candidatus Pelagibacter sp. TMED64]
MDKKKESKILQFTPNKLSETERQVEAILFAAEEPLDEETIQSKVKKNINIKKILDSLQNHYSSRGINLVCILKKWSFRTAKNLSSFMNTQKSVQKKLSRATIETLAIIVYHQPATRSEIEEIRGVAFGNNTLEILLELNWVRPQGRKDIPGRPIQYVTTETFLSHFNLTKISDLPNIEELTSAGLIDSGKIDSSIFGTGNSFEESKQNKGENIYTNIDDMLSSSLKNEDK